MKQNNDRLQPHKYSIPVIGITGGVGSGKSVVMDLLKKRYHAAVILADDVGHDLMEPGKANYQAIVEAFGTNVLGPEGQILRPVLASIVFSDENKLALLDQITHPNIRQEIRNRINTLIETKDYALIAVEAALLIEGDYAPFFDELWYVYVEKERRIERLSEGRGYTREKCLSIIDSQLSDDVFFQSCQRVIDNNGTIDDIILQLDRILGETV